MRRVSVVGNSGSGKTTTALALGTILGLPVLELDGIYHQPGWRPLDDEDFRARVDRFTSGDRWIVDGNYTSNGVASIVWPRADTVVWLDTSRSVVIRRVVARTLLRVLTRQDLWNGNREPWTNLWHPRPERNVIVWAWTRHPMVRERYTGAAADGTWAHLTVHRLRSQAEVDSWLASL
jgi:adenylate kinase family enzyme